MTEKWTVPPELAAYDRYTNYPGRAEELVNHPATMFNNVVVTTMRAETAAQYSLLNRLREAGLLIGAEPSGAKPPGDTDLSVARAWITATDRGKAITPHGWYHVVKSLLARIDWHEKR